MNNNKWKKIRIVARIILIILLVPYLYYLGKGIVFQANGWYLAIPGPALFKWYEIFLFEAFGYTIYSGIIIIADVVFIAISSKIIKKQN